jgi:hypothetical protein
MPYAKKLSHGRRKIAPPTRALRKQANIVLAMVLLPVVVVLPLVLGCSKEEMNQALESAKSKTKAMTASAVEAVEEKLPESGEITLNLKPDPVTISNVDIELISIGDGRPNVVQITTYDPQSPSRSYPALLLHGITNTSTTSTLAGEKVRCDVYYQESETSPVAMTKPGEAITIEFQQYSPTDNALTATLGMIALRGSDDSVIQIEGGDLLAVIREETK